MRSLSGAGVLAARSAISACTSPSTCDLTELCCPARRASSIASLSSSISASLKTFYVPLKARKNSHFEIRNPKFFMAERVGFEPTERFPAHSISSAANSTTLAPLQHCQFPIANCQLVTAGIDLLWQMTNRQSAIKNRQCYGGEGGIRTHGGR